MIKVKFLGTRGSIPVEGPTYVTYGGPTSCIQIEIENQLNFLDAGSGFFHAEWSKTTLEKEVAILLSHTHLDHILGIPSSRLLYLEEAKVAVYGASREGLTIKQQLDRCMAPPLWPVGTESFSAKIHYHEVQEEFLLGDKVRVRIMEGNHPGGSTVYRLEYKGKSIVYATDYEITEISRQRLVDFSKGANLLICDGQYSEEEEEAKIGFGHSSWEKACELGVESQCEQICIFHHDPYRTDAQLMEIEEMLQRRCSHCFLAKKGQSVLL